MVEGHSVVELQTLPPSDVPREILLMNANRSIMVKPVLCRGSVPAPGVQRIVILFRDGNDVCRMQANGDSLFIDSNKVGIVFEFLGLLPPEFVAGLLVGQHGFSFLLVLVLELFKT